MRFGDHVQGQELGQHLGVELVVLARALRDDAKLTRVSQHHAIRQRLQKLEQPLIAGGSFDHRLKRLKSFEVGDDSLAGRAEQSLATKHVSPLVHDAQYDSLLVEVDADVVHGSLLVWKHWDQQNNPNVYHELKAPRTAARPPAS